MFDFLIALIVFLFVISFLIISHELGHFIIAKKAGLKVEEFGIGYPPKIWSKKIGETLYSINAIPFGGFVRIYGEMPDKKLLKDKKSFCAQSPKVKTKVILGGVVANILIALVLFYLILGFNGFQSYQALLFDYQFPFGRGEAFPTVIFVAENSPAQKSGLKPYDLVLAVDGYEINNIDQFINYINEHKGTKISLLIKNLLTRKERIVEAIPRKDYPENEGPLGIAVSQVLILSYKSLPSKIFAGFLHTANLVHYSFRALGHFIKESFVTRNIEPLEKSVAGFVGIFAMVKMSLAAGFWQVLNLVALISLGLALINILPIPASDGGRMVFVLYEAIAKKPAPPELERRVNAFGFTLIIFLLIAITYKDIIQFKDILFK